MNYQFCIRFENTTTNSAASKAVLDCNRILAENGYKDYTITVWDNSNKLKYYLLLIRELFKFFLALKKGSLVCVQYPILSINNVFKYFIKSAQIKKVKFFCVIHDLESLRTGGQDCGLIQQEISNLNRYDQVIVHNPSMLAWLTGYGFKKKNVSLEIFDYLSGSFAISNPNHAPVIAFAGNLGKSTFIYSLSKITNWTFNVYGPHFNLEKSVVGNVSWCGEFTPDEIVENLDGSFGLIWDGIAIYKSDDLLGNYLKYNNPHKFSLYIAAGLPVIAPADSAIGAVIKQYNIGLVVNSLIDLENVAFDSAAYSVMHENVLRLRKRVIAGNFFSDAILSVERELTGTQAAIDG